MIVRIFLVFIAVSLLELYLLIKVGTYIGAGAVVGLVLLTALAGIIFAKRQGVTVFRRMGEEISQGRFPGGQLLDGVMVVAGGILLISPGFCADLLGILLLLPPSRYLLKKLLGLIVMRRLHRGGGRHVTIYRSRW